MRRALALLLACGCSAPEPPAARCSTTTGLDADRCLLPYPSSAFLTADPSTRTGWRIAIPADAMPVDDNGDPPDPSPWNRADGFSPMTSLIAQFPSLLEGTSLPSWHDPSASLAPGSPIVLIDVDTGARVALFAEIESSPEVAAGHSELYLRPAARLGEGRHYAVGLRGLRDTSGRPIAASPWFAKLRDGHDSAARQAAFDRDVFAPLVAAGVARADLVLAWDFRTASGPTAYGELLAMRDAAVAAQPASMSCTITSSVEDPTDPLIFRTVEGTVTLPNFLDASGATLTRDSGGAPAVTGTLQANFVALIPRTAIAASAPAPLWVYGHGLFSDRTELTRDFGRATASQAGAVAVATDYLGLAMKDIPSVVNAVENMALFQRVLDRLRQGILDNVLLWRAIAVGCAGAPAFQNGGKAIASAQPQDWGYFGNSMGGTLGFTVAALSPEVTRFAIGVGGEDFSVMMSRTNQWPTLQAFFEVGYPTRLDRDLLLVMAQQQWELAESSAFAPHLLADPLPGSQPVHLLVQLGLYDADTTNIASEMAARTVGLPELSPTAHAVPGLMTIAAPADSALVYYDLGAQPLPDGTLPPPMENGVHEGVRRDPRAQKQIVAFLRNGGTVVDTCSGACAP
jgi:hypothetical protein